MCESGFRFTMVNGNFYSPAHVLLLSTCSTERQFFYKHIYATVGSQQRHAVSKKNVGNKDTKSLSLISSDKNSTELCPRQRRKENNNFSGAFWGVCFHRGNSEDNSLSTSSLFFSPCRLLISTPELK